MPTLRKLIDGVTMEAAAPMQKPAAKSEETGSPMAKHVAEHLTDPLESTKQGFEDLNEAKLKYNIAQEKMRRNLLPVQSVINHVSQMHQLSDDEQLGTHPVDPYGADAAQGYQQERQGVPPNMIQKPGMMQQSAPSRNTSYPGVGPKIPTPPMGVPAEQNQQKPMAGKPKGAGSMPKKPGAAGAKKPGGQSGRAIKVNVTAVGNGFPIANNSMTLNKTMDAERLRTMSKVQAGGPGSGCQGENCGRHRTGTEQMLTQAGYKPSAKAFNRDGSPQTWKHPDHPDKRVRVTDKGWKIMDKVGAGMTPAERREYRESKQDVIEKGAHKDNDDLAVALDMIKDDEYGG